MSLASQTLRIMPIGRPGLRLEPLLRLQIGQAGPSTQRIFSRAHLSTTSIRSDIASQIEERLNPRELIEKKRKLFEAKYGDKLKKKVEQEGVEDLDALKLKVMAPSVRSAVKAGMVPKRNFEAVEKQQEASASYSDSVDRSRPARTVKPEEANKSGIKPLSSILNLPLLHLTPHTSEDISKIWTAYHTAHPSLSSSFLSASLPTSTYKSMITVAQENPFFVLPLPRDAAESPDGKVKTDEYEMFYLQWLFHPTPHTAPPTPGETQIPLPPTTSIIFTPLEEYKMAGEWASPFLVLTHYPDLAQSHNTVLMRGEITAQSATGPPGSLVNPGWLLSQQQAQLLALALQRFYCADVAPRNETAGASLERAKRKQTLGDFRTKPEEWDWTALVDMSYGGMI